jgi:hypothetical protein
MKRLTALLLGMMCFVLFSLPVEAQTKRPTGPVGATKSEFFTSQAALMLLDKDAPEVRFGLTLGVVKALPAGATLIVEFEAR